MTIQLVIDQIRTMKPNAFEDEVLVRWISDLEGMIYDEVILTHEGGEEIPHGPYDPIEDMETLLIVPEPYSDVYTKWLCAQIDFHNSEFARYNNDMAMYNASMATFADWYNRTHLPKQPNFVRCM